MGSAATTVAVLHVDHVAEHGAELDRALSGGSPPDVAFMVKHCRSLEEVLKQATVGYAPDVIICALRLPGVEPRAIVDTLRGLYLGSPVLAITDAPVQGLLVPGDLADAYVVRAHGEQNPGDLAEKVIELCRGHHRHYLEVELRNLLQQDTTWLDWIEGAALDGIWYWDLQNMEEEWYSPGFAALLGYTSIPHKSSWWKNCIHPDDVEPCEHAFREHINNPLAPYDLIVRYRHREGHWVWVRCRGRIVRSKDGEATRMLGAHTDVTSLNRVQEALKRRNIDLERTSYILSHDLRKPVRHMVGLAEILVEDYGNVINPEVQELVSEIREAGRRFDAMLDGILEFGRAGELVQPAKVNILSVWEGAVSDYESDLTETDVSCEVDGAVFVFGNAGMLYQLFSNLIGNAIKFRRADRKLSLGFDARAVNGSVVIRISDNGVGIPEDMRVRAFDLFRRVGPSARTTEGMGLGLAVCAKIAEAHGGTIEALETRGGGGGTTIQVVLPSLNKR